MGLGKAVYWEEINYLFNFHFYTTEIICEENYPRGLRCYSDNSFGNYETGMVDSCTHFGKWVGIEEFSQTGFELWPIPSQGSLHIQSPVLGHTQIDIYDLSVILANNYLIIRCIMRLWKLIFQPCATVYILSVLKTFMESKPKSL